MTFESGLCVHKKENKKRIENNDASESRQVARARRHIKTAFDDFLLFLSHFLHSLFLASHSTNTLTRPIPLCAADNTSSSFLNFVFYHPPFSHSHIRTIHIHNYFSTHDIPALEANAQAAERSINVTRPTMTEQTCQHSNMAIAIDHDTSRLSPSGLGTTTRQRKPGLHGRARIWGPNKTVRMILLTTALMG